ncbi:uncharacterized protein [Diadema setosum]|uniref:uncharacterized protein n=1 Tax=Diadema setosum TaxID=31175 RepID=UPI003B3ACB2F
MGAIRSVLMILQIIILVGIVITSLTSAITISLLKGDFDGGCPLYPSFIRREAHVIYISLNDVSNCQYIIGFNAVALVLAILIGVGRAVEVIKQQGISDSPLFTLLMGILCGVITLLALISACIVTMGFKALCHQLVSHEPNASKEEEDEQLDQPQPQPRKVRTSAARQF